MLKRWLGRLGLAGSLGSSLAATAAPDPALYEPLFCDRPALYRAASPASAAPWQVLLFDAAADPARLRTLASDPGADSRVRALAWARLRELRQPVPGGELLGLVIEVEVGGGLDVLAAYADGRVRYLNHGGRVVLLDALPQTLRRPWQALMAAAAPAGRAAAPWSRQAAPAPGAGQARIAFIRSDGLAMRQGSFAALQHDPATGPVPLAGAQVLQQLTQSLR